VEGAIGMNVVVDVEMDAWWRTYSTDLGVQADHRRVDSRPRDLVKMVSGKVLKKVSLWLPWSFLC
jgi:hypothetical protein